MKECLQPEQFYRSIFDEINDAVLIYDTKSNELVEINKRVLDLFGYTDKHDFGSNIFNCLTTEEPYIEDRFRKYVRKALINEPQLIEWRVKNKDGHHFGVELNLKRTTLAGCFWHNKNA